MSTNSCIPQTLFPSSSLLSVSSPCQAHLPTPSGIQVSSLSSLPRGEETTNKATEGQAVGVGGEEAKVWHWQRLQCLALAKKAQAGEVGQEAEGGNPALSVVLTSPC